MRLATDREGGQAGADLDGGIRDLRFSMAQPALYQVMFGAEVPAKAQFPEPEQAATAWPP